MLIHFPADFGKNGSKKDGESGRFFSTWLGSWVVLLGAPSWVEGIRSLGQEWQGWGETFLFLENEWEETFVWKTPRYFESKLIEFNLNLILVGRESGMSFFAQMRSSFHHGYHGYHWYGVVIHPARRLVPLASPTIAGDSWMIFWRWGHQPGVFVGWLVDAKKSWVCDGL